MTTFHFKLTDHGVAPLIRMVQVKHPGVVSKAFNRVVLDIREEEAKMVAHSFEFWSAVTKSFLANTRAFPFEPATPSKLIAKVHTSAKQSVSDIMVKQETGFTLTPGQKKQLQLGQAPPFYAIPTEEAEAELRTPRGRVRPGQTPAALLKNTGKLGPIKIKKRARKKKGQAALGTHVFVSPNRRAILEVTPSGKRRILYGLYTRKVPVPQHTTFFDTAVRTIGIRMIPKLLQEWDKVFGRFSAK